MEWLFGDIINYFKFLDFKKNLKYSFLDFKKNLKIQLSAVGEMYLVCTLLKIARNCFIW